MGSPRQTPVRMAETPEIWKAVAMADHFEKIQKLPEPIPGCPNFRRVPGYKVYCCGQPTVEGFEKALEKVCGTIYPKDGKIKDNGEKLKYVDVNKQEAEVEVKTIVPLHDVIEGLKEKFPGLVHMRIPICNSASPLEKDFDTLCNTLVGTAINTPIILNDQVGLSRATTASVAACMFKEFQLSASYEGLVETVPGMNLTL